MSKNDRQTVLRVVSPSNSRRGKNWPAASTTAASTIKTLPMARLIADKIDASIQMLIRFNEEQRWWTAQTVEVLVSCFKLGGKVLVAGNGGSAAEAQHLAGELVGRFYHDREPLPVIALDGNTAVVTAIANDYGYECVFSRQIRALGNAGDVLIAISTSGRSANIIEAVREARRRGMKTIGFLSERPSELADMVDIPLRIPSTDTPSIQEGHVVLTHLICSLVERIFLTGEPTVEASEVINETRAQRAEWPATDHSPPAARARYVKDT